MRQPSHDPSSDKSDVRPAHRLCVQLNKRDNCSDRRHSIRIFPAAAAAASTIQTPVVTTRRPPVGETIRAEFSFFFLRQRTNSLPGLFPGRYCIFYVIGHIVVLFCLYVSISVCVGLCITTCICPAFYAVILVINIYIIQLNTLLFIHWN